MDTATTLLIPEKTDLEFEEIFASWLQAGGQIKRLGKFWIKDEEIAKQKIAIYGNQAFAFVLAQIYNVNLLSPDDTLIARLDSKWVKRKVTVKQIENLTDVAFPAFIKPVIPKIFLAGIFNSLADFSVVTSGLPASEKVIVSSIVTDIIAEARSFVNEGQVLDIAIYEGMANLTEGEIFLKGFLNNHKDSLPAAVVVDIACSKTIGWFVLEFNACWGAGLNGCKAEKVMESIAAATLQ